MVFCLLITNQLLEDKMVRRWSNLWLENVELKLVSFPKLCAVGFLKTFFFD